MRLIAPAVLALFGCLPLACSASDVPARFLLDQHYKAVRTVQPPADPLKIEVMEVFSYSCPHCFHFEPMVDQWLEKKPADVEFTRLQWGLGQPVGILRSKAFYAAKVLGVLDKFHKALFGAIHGQGKMMATTEELRALFVEQTGLKGEDFDGAFTGFAVDNRVRKSENLVRDLGITSVPTVVVDGRWYTNGTLAGGGSNNNVFDVVDFLVQQARTDRKLGSPAVQKPKAHKDRKSK